MMKYTQFTYLFVSKLFIFIVLVSCQQNGKYTTLLLQIDSIMITRPDSALALLNSIQSFQEMKPADKASYSLLLTQAKQKSRISHTNDSLIRIAVEYYKDKGDEKQATKAYYYLGCVYQDIGDIVGATDAFLKALNINPQVTSDKEILTMTYEGLAECYQDQSFYDKAMEMYRNSYQINKEKNDKKNILYSIQGIAETFIYKNMWDSAEYYYNEIIVNSRMLGDSSWVSVGFVNLALIYYEQKRYPEAYQAIKKPIYDETEKKRNEQNETIDLHLLKADIFIQTGQYDSARYYLSLCYNKGDPFSEVSTNYSLYELEKKCGRFKEAIQYIDAYVTLSDSIQEEENRKEIAKLINDFAIEKYKKKFAYRQKRQNRIIFSSMLIFVVTSILIFLTIDRRRKKEYIALQKSLMRKREEIMKVQEELIELDATQSESSKLEKENKQDLLRELQKEKFHYSIQLFQKTPYYKILEELKLKRKIEEKTFTLEEREYLWDCIYQTFSDTMVDLKAKCPELTREDLLYCVFYLLGYPNPIIIVCTGSNANALKSRKNRIKNKMNEELRATIFNTDSKSTS